MSGSLAASVIVPVFNGARTLPGLLAALKGQRAIPGGFEVIVIDNNSTDGSADIARAAGVTVLHERTPGPAAARNAGLRAARGAVIACADSDTTPSRRWLGALVAALQAPDCFAATGPIVGCPPESDVERFVDRMGLFDRKSTVDHPRFPFAPGMNVAFRRADLEAVGGWDESLSSGEDWDLCVRLRARMGFAGRVGWAEAAGTMHRHRQSEEGLRRQARWYGQGQYHLRRKHPVLGTWLPFFQARRVLFLTVYRFTGPLVRTLRATGAISHERAEFERLYRMWILSYWSGFADAKRGRELPPTACTAGAGS